ncbi:MAG: Gfo/Idh/MocA family oxidoreductase [Actinobacteria bacterium]|nr:Gfo/Idh/MocA family oxidoreductase [Actinomycetota bacterium]
MINLALIGVGAWGKNFLSTVKSFNNCRIKYVCSKTQNTLQSLPDNYIKTTNYKDFFKFSDINGVIIATPASTHFQIAKDLLEKNMNLLIEKPLTIDYQEALKLKLLQDKSRSKVLLGHVYLFDPAYIKAKKLIKEIGPIQYLFHEMLNSGPFCKDVSILWHLGPHTISLFLDIFQEDPIEVKAWGFYDLVFLNLKFPNKTQAFAKLSWLSPTKKRELVIVGSNKTIVYSDLVKKKVAYYHQNMNPLSKVTYPAYGSGKPLEIEVKEFIDAIQENKDIEKSNLDFGVKVTRLLTLAEKSLENNGKVMKIK